VTEQLHQVHRERYGRYVTLLCWCGWTVRGIVPRHADGYERIHLVSGLTREPPQPACELGQPPDDPAPRPRVLGEPAPDQPPLPSDW
jgi:hypothetical protein